MIGESSNQNINVESIPQTHEEEDSDYENYVVKGTRTLQDVYSRCNVTTLKPVIVDQALQSPKWKATITWLIVDRLKNQQVIGIK